MKELDLTQIEQLKTIGEYLHQARQARAISLDEIAVKTYIPLRLLQALELGQFERLPEPVFVQGFIRRYADVLGLDGMSLSKSFSVDSKPTFGGSAQPKAEPLAAVNSKPEPDTSVQSVMQPETFIPDERHSPTDRAKTKALPFLPLVLGCVCLVGVGVAVVMVNRAQFAGNDQEGAIATNRTSEPSPASSSEANQSQPHQTPPISPSPQTTTTASPTPIAAQPSNATNQATPIEVAIKLTDDSWIEVVVDGKTEFEGTLKKGDQKTWTAKKAMTLRSGNAGAVSVSYNQGESKPLGALGDVKDATFPPNQTQPSPGN